MFVVRISLVRVWRAQFRPLFHFTASSLLSLPSLSLCSALYLVFGAVATTKTTWATAVAGPPPRHGSPAKKKRGSNIDKRGPCLFYDFMDCTDVLQTVNPSHPTTRPSPVLNNNNNNNDDDDDKKRNRFQENRKKYKIGGPRDPHGPFCGSSGPVVK